MLAIKELLDSFYHMVVQRLYLFRGGGPHAVQCSAERHAGVCQPGQAPSTSGGGLRSAICECCTSSTTLGGTISNEIINDLPLNGRNYQNLVSLRPGTMIYPGGGPWTQSTNGIRPEDTSYIVDGITNDEAFMGLSVTNAAAVIGD